MADFILATDDTARDTPRGPAAPDTAEREPGSFHRWVNRRWPRREQRDESEPVEL